MPEAEENDKKISYKILTAEHLIEEKETESKQTKLSNEISIEPEVVKKVEAQPQKTPESEAMKFTPEVIKVESEVEKGVIHPSVEEVTISPVSFTEKPAPSLEVTPEQKPAIELEGLKPEPFVAQQPEVEVKPKFEIIKSESLVSNETPSSSSLPREELKKIGFKLPVKLSLKIIVIVSGIIILSGGIIIIKPHEKIKAILSERKLKKDTGVVVSENLASKLPKLITTTQPIIAITSTETTSVSIVPPTTTVINQEPSATITVTIPTTTVITQESFVTTTVQIVTSATKTIETKLTTITTTTIPSKIIPPKTKTTVTKSLTTKTTTTSLISTLTKSTISTSGILTKPTMTTRTNEALTITTTISSPEIDLSSEFSILPSPSEIIIFPNIFEKKITLNNLTLSEFKTQFNSFLIYQDFYGSLINLKIVAEDKPVPVDLIFSYFIRPTKIKLSEIENFKQSLNNKFALLIFYGYTRKYPILIFEVNNPKSVMNFNSQWMKNNMANDLQSLFLGQNAGKPISKFTLKKIKNFSYNIIYFQNNFQIVWSLVNNYLIYSASELGLQQIINHLEK